MFQNAAEEIISFMLKHKLISHGKNDIYRYAIEVLLLNGGLLLINLIISIIFHEISVFAAFILIFVPIRVYLGGFHFKSPEVCMFCSIIFYLIVMFMHHTIFIKYGMMQVIVLIFVSLICIVLKPLPEKIQGNKSHNKNIANCIIVFYLLLILFCIRIDFIYSSVMIVFYISTLIFYLIEKITILMKDIGKNN